MTSDAAALVSEDSLVCHGQACVTGTRIPVSVVLDCLADGMTDEEIVEQYPSLSTALIAEIVSLPINLRGE